MPMWWLLPLLAALAEQLPGCTPAFAETFFLVDKQISSLHFLLLVLLLAIPVDWEELLSVPGLHEHWNRSRALDLASHNRFSVQTVALDGVGN